MSEFPDPHHPYQLTYALMAAKQRELLEAMRQLDLMSAKYGKAKAAFDLDRERRGESFEDNPLAYMEAKKERIHLGYWYSKVEHYQRQVAALGAFLTGLSTSTNLLHPSTRPGVPVAREATRSS